MVKGAATSYLQSKCRCGVGLVRSRDAGEHTEHRPRQCIAQLRMSVLMNAKCTSGQCLKLRIVDVSHAMSRVTCCACAQVRLMNKLRLHL